MQYLYWLIGNDWDQFDRDGDGVEESPGTRTGILRGDFGTSLVNRGVPVTEVIGERLSNTLILMLTAEVVIIVFSLLVGIYSALRRMPLWKLITGSCLWLLHAYLFIPAGPDVHLRHFQAVGVALLPTVGM